MKLGNIIDELVHRYTDFIVDNAEIKLNGKNVCVIVPQFDPQFIRQDDDNSDWDTERFMEEFDNILVTIHPEADDFDDFEDWGLDDGLAYTE